LFTVRKLEEEIRPLYWELLPVKKGGDFGMPVGGEGYHLLVGKRPKQRLIQKHNIVYGPRSEGGGGEKKKKGLHLHRRVLKDKDHKREDWGLLINRRNSDGGGSSSSMGVLKMGKAPMTAERDLKKKGLVGKLF